MLSLLSGRSRDTLKLPNHTLLYGIVIATLGVLVTLGSLTRLYELREFFPIRLPEQVNDFILNFIPFILGTFITTVAASAGVIVGLNWISGGFKEVARLKIRGGQVGDYFQPEHVSLGLKEGRLKSYERAPSLFFFLLGKLWSNARYVAEIPGEIVRRNIRFVWKAAAVGVLIHFLFTFAESLPQYFKSMGLGSGYVVPSPNQFYNLLAVVCVLRFAIGLSLIPLKKPGVGREMDSMIVEGRGHPSVFFAILEEGSKIFAHKGFSNRIARSRPVACKDGETLIGTLIESFPEYVKTSCRSAAVLSLVLGSVMVLVGFLQIVLMQYPSFSVGYEEFFRLYLLSLVADIIMNIAIILLGKNFMDQARALMSMYRFRSSLVYVEAKGDFERKVLPDLSGVVSPERLFNPLSPCAFNVRYFSAEAISEAITPDGTRDLVGLETSARLAKDVARLKFLPFQVNFKERYPSLWNLPEAPADDEQEEVLAAGEASMGIEEHPDSDTAVSSGAYE